MDCQCIMCLVFISLRKPFHKLTGKFTNLLKSTVLPNKMKQWKNRRCVSAEIAVDSSMSSKVQPRPKYRRAPRISNSIGDVSLLLRVSFVHTSNISEPLHRPIKSVYARCVMRKRLRNRHCNISSSSINLFPT